MPMNKLAVEVSLCTGLRIGDVLSLKRAQVNKQRFTIHEQKTGKPRRIYIPEELQKVLLQYGGEIYIFENRLNPKKPRSRQAVYKDLKRAAKLFRIKGANVSPHTARKIFAVSKYQTSGSLKQVQKLLNHSSEAVTQLYAMADEITLRKHKKIK
jgi:integrase